MQSLPPWQFDARIRRAWELPSLVTRCSVPPRRRSRRTASVSWLRARRAARRERSRRRSCSGPRRVRSQVRRRPPGCRRRLRQGRRHPARGAAVMTPSDLTRRLAARKHAVARLATRCHPRLRAGRLRTQRQTRRPRALDRDRLALLSPRRGSIARDLKASAALSRDRRHRGRALTPGRFAADLAPSRVSTIRHKTGPP